MKTKVTLAFLFTGLLSALWSCDFSKPTDKASSGVDSVTIDSTKIHMLDSGINKVLSKDSVSER